MGKQSHPSYPLPFSLPLIFSLSLSLWHLQQSRGSVFSRLFDKLSNCCLSANCLEMCVDLPNHDTHHISGAEEVQVCCYGKWLKLIMWRFKGFITICCSCHSTWSVLEDHTTPLLPFRSSGTPAHSDPPCFLSHLRLLRSAHQILISTVFRIGRTAPQEHKFLLTASAFPVESRHTWFTHTDAGSFHWTEFSFLASTMLRA